MKILIVFFLFLTLIVPSTSNHGDASSFGIPLKNYQSITFFIYQDLISHYDLLEDLIVLPENEFNENEAILIIQRLGEIDKRILSKLVAENIQIILFNGQLTDLPTAAHLKGTKPRGYSETGPIWDDVPGIGGSRTVLVKIGHSQIGKGHGSMNLELHELAHSVDKFVFNSVRSNKAFQEIWREEAPKLFPNRNYFIYYPEEYFAESFVYYYLNNETKTKMQVDAPKTYSFLEGLIKTLPIE